MTRGSSKTHTCSAITAAYQLFHHQAYNIVIPINIILLSMVELDRQRSAGKTLANKLKLFKLLLVSPWMGILLGKLGCCWKRR